MTPDVIIVHVGRALAGGMGIAQAAQGDWRVSESLARHLRHLVAVGPGSTVVGVFDISGFQIPTRLRGGRVRFDLHPSARRVVRDVPRMYRPFLYSHSADLLSSDAREGGDNGRHERVAASSRGPGARTGTRVVSSRSRTLEDMTGSGSAAQTSAPRVVQFPHPGFEYHKAQAPWAEVSADRRDGVEGRGHRTQSQVPGCHWIGGLEVRFGA